MPEMIVKSILPWFGGKRTMSPEIIKLLGKHTQYFEPFCGSMAVLLAKPPSQKETVNDLHGDLINLARVIQNQNAAEQLYDRLQRALLSEDLLEQARNTLVEADELILEDLDCMRPQSVECIDRAYWYFLASWQGRNGTAGTARVDYQIAVRWTKGGGSPAVRWQHAVDSLPAWHLRLRNVVILRRDARKILDRFEDCSATAVYVDPPYAGETRTGYRNQPGSDNKYVHEFNHAPPEPAGLFGEPEKKDNRPTHEEIAKILRQYKEARIVVSYYDCERIRKLYDGWKFHVHTRTKSMSQGLKRGDGRQKEAPEILITNF